MSVLPPIVPCQQLDWCTHPIRSVRRKMADKQSDTLLAAKVPKHYGRVIINLENCLLPPERLACTASYLDGLDPETEMDLRILGCELIQTAGILLRLPQVVACCLRIEVTFILFQLKNLCIY